MKNKIPQFIKDPKVLAKIIVCSFCLSILYFSVFKSMVYDWQNIPDFSHGFIIPFISLYFVWERSKQLSKLSLTPSNYGILIIVIGIFLHFIGTMGGESFTMRFSFIIVLAGIVLFLLGWSHLKELSFPIIFLIFMIPIPSIFLVKITFPMQLFASKVSVIVLQIMGVPVFREGNIIHLTETTLEVAEACSGIRSLISLLALGVVFAYFAMKKFWQRVILVLSCLPISIIVNALRVSATGVLASFYGESVAQGFFHEFSGLILFVIAFTLMIFMNLLIIKIQQYLER